MARPWRKRLAAAALGIGGLLFVWWVWPSPIDPVAWDPPTPLPLTGVYEPNEVLRGAEQLAVGEVDGVEDVDVDAQGRVYGGQVDGKIIRVGSDGGVDVFADTQGRPLGMQFDPEGNLVVCDSSKGLLSIDPAGEITVLATEAGGVPFGFADDVDVGRDGTIYFSDASWKFGQPDYVLDLLEGRAHGRLVRYDPKTQAADVLLDELYFANGVALSLDEDFVLVNETYRFRITRLWLKGPRAGESEVFIDNLPGYPDGVSRDDTGRFWVAFYTVRNPMGDFLARHPTLSSMMAKLPRMLWPGPKRYGLVLGLSAEGEPLHALHDPTGEHVTQVTSAEPVGDRLYLGGLHADRISVVDLP